ncbi:MAG: hypothetical protein N4A36_03390 [Candidatus Gracilibacteria bacterium]|nr:hypothetical protein [Candidatus Gracilibacteria bacterium]
MKYIFQFGINPHLSKTEISYVLPHFQEISSFSQSFFLYEGEISNAQKLIEQLGGTIRIAEMIEEISIKELSQAIAEFLIKNHKEGKLNFGITSFCGFRDNRKVLNEVKKLLKGSISIRFANRNFQNLDAGTLHKEKLLSKGFEIMILKKGEKFTIFHTIAAQNIDKFSERDYKKPFRDMEVGMLPPKLALMMLNFTRENGILPKSIYDPFCGTGTVLIEGENLGLRALGSDISEKVLEMSRKNLEYFFGKKERKIFKQDARDAFKKELESEAICCEAYLGPIFKRSLNEKDLEKALSDTEDVIYGFLRNMHTKIKGDRAVIALPFWQTQKGEIFLKKVLEIIEKFWENRTVSLTNRPRKSLLFRRKEQKVGREIIILQKRSSVAQR